MKDLTIFVSSCDKYSDLWNPFFTCFSRFFNYDNEEIILVSESKTFKYEGLNIVTYPDYNDGAIIPWGELFLHNLNKVKTKYILFMLDDFFIRKPVNTQIISNCLSQMEINNNIMYFSFSLVEDIHNTESKYSDFLLRSKKSPYKLNTQPALWRTEDLKKLVLPSDNPWDWEIYGSRRLWYTDKECYCLNNYNSVIDYGYNKNGLWSVYRGKWIIEDVKSFFDSINCDVDYNLRGVYVPYDYRKDPLVDKLKRLPNTFKLNIDNMKKRVFNSKFGKKYKRENG